MIKGIKYYGKSDKIYYIYIMKLINKINNKWKGNTWNGIIFLYEIWICMLLGLISLFVVGHFCEIWDKSTQWYDTIFLIFGIIYTMSYLWLVSWWSIIGLIFTTPLVIIVTFCCIFIEFPSYIIKKIFIFYKRSKSCLTKKTILTKDGK